MRKSLGHLTLGGATAAGFVLMSTPAYAEGQDYYISSAVDNLTASNVYVDSTVSVASPDSLNALDSSVAYVALPAQATDAGLTASGLASQILQGAAAEGKTYKAVIVTVGNSDSLPVSAAGPAGVEVATIINSAGASGSPVSVAVGATSAEITGAVNQASTTTSTSSDGGVDAAPLVAVGGGVLGIVIVGAVIAVLARRGSRNQIGAAKNAALKGKPIKLSFDHIPSELRKSVDSLREAMNTLRRRNQPDLADQVQVILADSEQLFVRIKRKGTEQQAKMAAVEYTNSFDKLTKALGDDYYLDFIENPRMWDDAETRAAEVWEAVQATQVDVLRNIKLVNKSQDLEFKVALESLTKSLNSIDAHAMLENKPLEAN